jgi:glyoxylase-like metal-dependent hydrolase (beta-lactamase superfamily II)
MAEPDRPLEYPLDIRPEPGGSVEIGPGLRWLRLPLPFQLNHINVWLLRDGDGWALVDTGLFTETTRTVWKSIFERELDGASLTRIIVTHLHPDHVGCAGWLARKFGAELWMSRDEYLLCRILVADTGRPAPPEGLRFYQRAGFDAEALDRYAENFGTFGRVVAPLPESYRRLYDGLTMRVGSLDWKIVIGRGHSPEHACLWCPEANLFISGDQILPTISSNVSVWPTEPAANPLSFWFESIERLRQTLPPDLLVLPAHGRPFTGVHARLDELRREHENGLAALRDLCREPRRAIDVFPALFKSRITAGNLMMATGEAISHLNYLIERDEMQAAEDASGVNRYRMGQ